MGRKVLVINPGSTSTKLGVFENRLKIFEKTIRHDTEELKSFSSIIAQFDYRYKLILKAVDEMGQNIGEMDAFIGRGGLLKPLISGTYNINKNMIEDLKQGRYGNHASNLGAIIAYRLGLIYGKKAYIADPVVVDELMDIARITGLPEMENRSIFHALNQKAVAKRLAKEEGKDYEKLNLIVAHLGGGVSVGVHKGGRVIHVNNALENGPFTPERAGSLPMKEIIDLCYSRKYTKEELMRKLIGRGGFVAHTGTSDCKILEEEAMDDPKIQMLLEAFVYGVAMEIGAGATVLYGKVDYIILTGGLAYSKFIREGITDRVSFLSPIVVYPGEDEMEALAERAYDVLEGKEKPLDY